MIFETDFEKLTVDLARRCTDDIVECDTAEVSVIWHGEAPYIRFVFGDKRLFGRPACGVAMIAESRKNPLAPGRLVNGDQLRRHIRDTIEAYLKAEGITISRKAFHACL